MPRHRVERTPRRRTLWPAGNVVGRVRLPTAGTRARRPGHARPGTGFSWAQLDRRTLAEAVRGLIVSPWFAAGAGFVIAAGVFVYVPHAQLTFGSAIQQKQCEVARCLPQGAPAIPAGTGARKLPTPSPSTVARRPAPADVTVSYIVNWQWGGQFAMLIKVQSRQLIGAWKLAFVIPGSTIRGVSWATWHPTGPDSGTASGQGGWSARPSSAADGSWPAWQGQRDTGGGPGGDGTTVMFLVRGTGTSDVPGGCVYNGAPCHFTGG